ncbi:MAG: hypothetical protein KF709_01235 [Gemmatimonadaceae bacterium]|nr:hypothetical protein [Gemmatimonadaceae bacterium]
MNRSTWFLVAAASSFLAVLAVRRYVLAKGVLDTPNARSSHTVPTPRGGGLGLMPVLLVLLSITVGAASGARVAGFLGFAVLLTAIVGWLDDSMGGIRPRTRFAAHLVAGATIAMIAPSLGLAGWLAFAWWTFWTAASINVVNFIDGIDGIIGVQALVFAAHVLLLVPQSVFANAAAVLAGAAVGFLLLNWAPARIFLGDAGSGGLGVVFVGLGALVIREGAVGLLATFLPLAPIFLDASVTLVRRAARGERLSEAHRSHVYQLLANGRFGHAPVTLLYGLASIAGLLLALWVPNAGWSPLAAYLAGLTLCGWVLLRMNRARGPLTVVG